jgi:hypothetical protein
MTKTDKQALRLLAEKATPGRWWIDSHGSAVVAFTDDSEVLPIFITDSDAMGPAVRHEETGNLSHWRNDNDASFIATASPQTVLALLDELEAKDKRIAELEARTLTVKLPPRVDGSNVPFTAHAWNCCLDEIEKRVAAAGIALDTGE